MYLHYQRLLVTRILTILAERFDVTEARVAVEQPPRVELGDYAVPIAFELARKLRKAPRAIAEDIVSALNENLPQGFASAEVAGAGYINLRLDRAEAIRNPIPAAADRVSGERVIVEHTSINPNKAAHVGHLRNAILGDTFVRLLRADSANVSVQNYIDNTGVQVADVIVALQHLEGRDLAGLRALLYDLQQCGERIDFYLWDLYARVSQWYEEDPAQSAARKKIRLDTLHALEAGNNQTSAMAEIVSTAVLHRHLETMARLGIEYDFLPRESDILQLHFWDAAFERMQQAGVLYKEIQGKNAGCWVMRRAGTEAATADAANPDGPDEDAKIIVRSNGTVTYVGKDIAYHLWKFGLLPGKDFGYKPFHEYADRHTAWISALTGDRDHPHFGDAAAIYNVIDARQADPQNNVRQAILGMGYTQQAAKYHHFSYEMVALTPRCAASLGYTLSEEDAQRSYIEVSGRKGFGVKADDLLDKLIAAALEEVTRRHPHLPAAEQSAIAETIAIGALRYYMLRYTRNSVIAFDFEDALSFEGETGPYAQYAAVRAANIFRKAHTTEQAALAAIAETPLPAIPDDIWELWLLAGKLSLVREQCVQSEEPAYLAKYVFETAQRFNNFYHRHHILTEQDAQQKALLLATAAAARQAIMQALALFGVTVPPVM